jgi:hypothetical protein
MDFPIKKTSRIEKIAVVDMTIYILIKWQQQQFTKESKKVVLTTTIF